MNKLEYFQMMDDMYKEEMDARKNPTLNPSRAWNWWFWRAYGFTIRRWLRQFWGWYTHSGLRCDCHGEYDPFNDESQSCTKKISVRRFPSCEKVKDWLDGIGTGKGVYYLWRYPLHEFLLGGGYECPCCAYGEWASDFLEKDGTHFEEISSSEYQTESGDHWDVAGWCYCQRCGYVGWYSDGD